MKNLLNSYEEKNKSYKIHESFSKYISSLESIGEYVSDGKEVELLVIRLKRSDQINKARSAQRNIVAQRLRGSQKDAALVAFVAPNKKDWRFSLIKLEITLDDLTEKFTPSRRYSFLVGENENSHTAKSRLAPILANDKINPSLEELEKAFDIEVVTSEFFEKYYFLYQKTEKHLSKILRKNPKIRKEFETKKIRTSDFAKKLLAQVVFLYFVQKKGWFGVEKHSNWGSGSKVFLREKFSENFHKSFFKEILEPLFYEALRVDRRNKNDYFKKFNCRIPFLNSGLFDPIGNYNWKELSINISNELFSNKNKTQEGDIGDGILDIFDRYNFTVKEDEPLEKEVAIDPEMLGKVFENLLESEDRKKSGAFYTPREIVHYMCQESLINYLDHKLSPLINRKTQDFRDHLEKLIRLGSSIKEKEAFTQDYDIGGHSLPSSIHKNAKLIDNALSEIRVCDPAVGSGAFLVGMMAEITNVRHILSSYLGSNNRSLYKLKRHSIENTLYGVDKEFIASEIAKLRLWLSLVVDEENIKEITPLPNLHYKIAKGNSLLHYPYQHRSLSEVELQKKQYLNETNTKVKIQLRKKIDQSIQNILKNSKKTLGYDVDFDFQINFSEVFSGEKKGFDIVIANPPYVRQEKIKEQKPNLEILYEVYNSTSDLYTYFYELSYRILNEHGFSTFISSNKWLRNKYGRNLREFLKKKTTVDLLIDFSGHKVFQSATVDTNILIFQKRVPDDAWDMEFVKIEDDYTVQQPLSTYVTENHQAIKQSSLQETSWILENPQVLKIKKKIEAKGVPLKDWDVEIKGGILTGCNEAFIIDTETKERLCKEDPKSAEIIKPILRGRDIGKYHCKWAGKWIINAHNGYKDSPRIDIPKNYPAIWKFLQTKNKTLKDRNGKNRVVEHRADRGEHWTNLRNCAYLDRFEKAKIVWPRVTGTIKFAFIKNEQFVLDSMCMITGNNLKLVISIINSKLIDFYLNTYTHKLSNGYLLSNQFIEQIPIPKIPRKEQIPFEKLVDKILALTDSEDYESSPSKKQRVVKVYEDQINQMVYELYGISEDEIRIIEKRPQVKSDNEVEYHSA